MKILEVILKLLGINKVYATGSAFFDDYPEMNGNRFVLQDAVTKANEIFGFGFTVIKWIWVFIFFMTCIVVVISWVRMAILADDIPQKKMVAKHDLATSLISLGVMGSLPIIFTVIMLLLNHSF